MNPITLKALRFLVVALLLNTVLNTTGLVQAESLF